MDQSLDEIIAERPDSSRPRGGRMAGSRRRTNFRGSHKPSRGDRADLDLDWVHDRFEDDRDSRSSRPPRQPRTDRYNSGPADQDSRGAKIRVSNIHYDLTQEDLEELFTRIGPVYSVSLLYDRAGRSEGTAFVTYKRLSDAETAIHEFDGANAKGQPIRLTLVPSSAPRRRNPFDSAEMPKGSLFDRAERPRGRDSRSLSPDAAEASGGRRGRRNNTNLAPPDNIDRYVPGQRSPIRKHDSGRNRGRRGGGGGRDSREATGSRNRGPGRTKKTQEELDQEMEDYWGKANADTAGGATNNTAENQPAAAQPAAQPAPAAGGEEDIDMIE
ncbi:RNA binding domain-containing protein [Trichophyton tonsurans CBS 112818]|uniref:RNA binding domain-containing protein n=1 Tax=Trichophyton tonsurans (strain CBS 112818) TaxID=647933 RepID=F2RPE8_TRIT1|nr:RNA binding domain-containing protein [Trichophyton tonsurans CBS 112818]